MAVDFDSPGAEPESGVAAGGLRVLVIDHYDSYTNNLVELIHSLLVAYPGTVDVVVHDDAGLTADFCRSYSHIVLSPGPGRPESSADFTCSPAAIRDFHGPVLGVCLGHQGIVTTFGGHVEKVLPAHGKVENITHNGNAIFADIPRFFKAVRYHSLAVVELTAEIEAIAHSEDGTVMAVAHRARPIWGVQFHPESIMTEYGQQLMANFLTLAVRRVRAIEMPAAPGANAQSDFGTPLNPQTSNGAQKTALQPSEVFATLAGLGRTHFWLDSSTRTEWTGRWSYMGWLDHDDDDQKFTELSQHNHSEQKRVLLSVGTDANSIWNSLKENERSAYTMPPLIGNPSMDFMGGWVGFIGYEAHIVPAPKHLSDIPHTMMMWVDNFLAFDHDDQRWYAIGSAQYIASAKKLLQARHLPAANLQNPPSSTNAHHDASENANGFGNYFKAFAQVISHLEAGDSYEVNLTYRTTENSSHDPLSAYLWLREHNPAPYTAYIRHEDLALLSCSPERFARVDQYGIVESKPIKGTTSRAADPAVDEARRSELATAERFQRENLMIVDLMRHDISAVSHPGTVQVSKLMEVESYRDVHQLITTIQGQLHTKYSTTDALATIFPPASMTGAPKLRTMEIIHEVETDARGFYSGVLGWINAHKTGTHQRCELAVTIRSWLWQADATRAATYTAGTGGGITVDADPAQEFAETQWKLRSLRRALDDQ